MSGTFQRGPLADGNRLPSGVCPLGASWRRRGGSCPAGRVPVEFLSTPDRPDRKEGRGTSPNSSQLLGKPFFCRFLRKQRNLCHRGFPAQVHVPEAWPSSTLWPSTWGLAVLCGQPGWAAHGQVSHPSFKHGAKGKSHPSLQTWHRSLGPNGCTIIKLHQSPL